MTGEQLPRRITGRWEVTQVSRLPYQLVHCVTCGHELAHLEAGEDAATSHVLLTGHTVEYVHGTEVTYTGLATQAGQLAEQLAAVRCTSCGRLSGMPSAPCRDCADFDGERG